MSDVSVFLFCVIFAFFSGLLLGIKLMLWLHETGRLK